jgi:hypothetical protein
MTKKRIQRESISDLFVKSIDIIRQLHEVSHVRHTLFLERQENLLDSTLKEMAGSQITPRSINQKTDNSHPLSP